MPNADGPTPAIQRVTPVIGLEIHVELATRSKMFTRVASPAHPDNQHAEPNTLTDPVVLALPGALPVINQRAVEMSALVGLALNCSIARLTKWDRKQYFYPDLPKAYQISQYDLPVCFDGAVDWPIRPDDDPEGPTKRVRITRAHLEEDAGKLMHEAPADMPELRRQLAGTSIVDLNRAGTPLLEIVTEPDFDNADETVAFCQHLRRVCRFLRVTEGDMQKGHMRFEPNINCVLHLEGGTRAVTPISEVKNLNSFRAVGAAIDHEIKHQPKRWQADRVEHGPGTKATYGWDDNTNTTVLQRSKEDAHDYRYFPDPDLLPIRLTSDWIEARRAELPELPHTRAQRYQRDFALDHKSAVALAEERDDAELFDATVAATLAHAGHAGGGGIERERAGKQAANVLLQGARALANERDAAVADLGLSPQQFAGLALLRANDLIDSAAVTPVLERMIDTAETAHEAAHALNLVKVKDTAALAAWVRQALEDPANEKSVADVRAGKQAAVGRLIGAVMKASNGQADAKDARAMILEQLS